MQNAVLNQILDDLEDAGLIDDPAEVLAAFSAWAEQTHRPLYPHQQSAATEIFSGNHLIAATPTGSGKSMIALAAHLYSLSRQGRTYYTAPLKALVSEKFFSLIELFGPANVGMVTGDATVNPDAPVICCTAEILAHRALEEGSQLDVDTVVMDEFHFYGDPQRGWAWQVPLLELPHAQFVLLSATLGPVDLFVKDLEARSRRTCAVVEDAPRPVPLEWNYTELDTATLMEQLVAEGRWPVYLVHFSQREAVASAAALASSNLLTRSQREEVTQLLAGFPFARKFGKMLSRLLRLGVGIHHAGMLPRYRRLVEQLTQRGLLAVVCGTDTLGVGINVPIKTVVLSSLVKYDGQRRRQLSAREFHQIAGRAGRAGYDTQGFVEVQAPPAAIEKAKLRGKLAGGAISFDARGRSGGKTGGGKGPRKPRPKHNLSGKGPGAAGGPGGQHQISWSEHTFHRLKSASPERLVPQFQIDHSLVLHVLRSNRPTAKHLIWLAQCNHAITMNPSPPEANPYLRQLGQIYHSLRQAQIIERVRDIKAAAPLTATATTSTDTAVSAASASSSPAPLPGDAKPPTAEGKPDTLAAGLEAETLQIIRDLPADFALNQPLAPFALAALDLLDHNSPEYALDLISVVEAVLEDPHPLLQAQAKQEKDRLARQLRDQQRTYSEIQAELEKITWPRPLAELLEQTFTTYAQSNPWVGDWQLSPKSVVRYLVENNLTFSELINNFNLASSEGVVLRYLTNALRTLSQIVPPTLRTEEFDAILTWLDQTVRAVDSSLLDEWESLLNGKQLSLQILTPNLEGDTTPIAQLSGDLNQLSEAAFQSNTPGESWTKNRFALRNGLRTLAWRHVEAFYADNPDRLVGFQDRHLDNRNWKYQDWESALDQYWEEYQELNIGPEAHAKQNCHILAGEEAWELLVRYRPELAGERIGREENYQLAAATGDNSPTSSIWEAILNAAPGISPRVPLAQLDSVPAESASRSVQPTSPPAQPADLPLQPTSPPDQLSQETEADTRAEDVAGLSPPETESLNSPSRPQAEVPALPSSTPAKANLQPSGDPGELWVCEQLVDDGLETWEWRFVWAISPQQCDQAGDLLPYLVYVGPYPGGSWPKDQAADS